MAQASDNRGAITVDEIKAVLARDYLATLDWRVLLNAALDPLAGPGFAREGLEFTGSAIFNGICIRAGVPLVTLPLLWSDSRLPMGFQLTGRRRGDARLLPTARWPRTHVEIVAKGGASQ